MHTFRVSLHDCGGRIVCLVIFNMSLAILNNGLDCRGRQHKRQRKRGTIASEWGHHFPPRQTSLQILTFVVWMLV